MRKQCSFQSLTLRMTFELGQRFKILLPVLKRGRDSLFGQVLKGLWKNNNIQKNKKNNNQNKSYHFT